MTIFSGCALARIEREEILGQEIVTRYFDVFLHAIK